MEQRARKKSAPVEVKTPAQNVETYFTLNKEVKDLEAELKTLKPLLKSYIPENRKAVAIEGRLKGKPVIYTITRIDQDRRAPNKELLMELLTKKGLRDEGCSPAPDDDKIAALIQAGKIKVEELAECLTGPKYDYITVDYRTPKKE